MIPCELTLGAVSKNYVIWHEQGNICTNHSTIVYYKTCGQLDNIRADVIIMIAISSCVGMEKPREFQSYVIMK